MKRVCGSNFQTYNNPCLLELESCQRNVYIYVQHVGECVNEYSNSYEVVEKCEKPCSREYIPVCGSNEVTYGNLCMFQNTLCSSPKLRIAYNGTCLQMPNVCKRTEFTCKADRRCISNLKKCDGFAECNDGSDKENCHGNCALTQFWCEDNSCIPFGLRCDGKFDCPDNSDELDCPVRCREIGEFTCNDGNCIESWKR